MEVFDVIIAGGGPAGLICARELADSGLSVLLVEKEEVFGDKVCAGGLTRKDLPILSLPDEMLQHKVYKTALYSADRKSYANTPDPIVFTIDRKDLGKWQASLLKDTHVKVIRNNGLKEIRNDRIILEDGSEIGYVSLIGADGFNSRVRRHLGLPQKKRLIGIQYIVPMPKLDPKLEIFLNSKYFKSWYAWIFPHKEKIAVGCVCDPRYFSPKKMKQNLHEWLIKKRIDISDAIYQSAPISYDYRGLKFDNIYLVGDAAGMGSGLTGEGIYQSLVSGMEVVRYIRGESQESDEMKAVIRYNRIQEKLMIFLLRIGPFRKLIYELIIMLMNNKRFKNRINKGFS